MAAVSDPVPIVRNSNSIGSSSNLSTTPTAIEPATPVIGSPNMSVLETIPKHKGEHDFRVLFDLPNSTLLDAFSAALQLKSLVLHGRFYVSSSAICFYSGVFGRKTSKVIRFDQIIGIYKRNTAKLFPNAVEVVTLQHKYFFCSFMFRDAAFRLASTAWTDYLEASPSNETHRIALNSKLDLELVVRKPTGDEQVKMMDTDAEDSESASGTAPGSSPPAVLAEGEESSKKNGKDKKLSDSGKSTTSTSAAAPPNGSPTSDRAPMSQLFGAAGVVDSSEDVDDGLGDRKGSKRRKSAAGKRGGKDVTSSAPVNADGGDNSEEPKRGEVPSPSHRHTVVVTQPIRSSNPADQLKAKAVGFDLRAPANSEAVPPAENDTSLGIAAEPNVGKASNGSPTMERRIGDSTSSASNAFSASTASLPAEPEPTLPEVPLPVPNTLSCKHLIEEAEDKKFTGTKLGTLTFKNLTLAQFFALVWSNPEYNQLLVADMDLTEWNAPPWGPSDGSCCLQRLVTYRMPLKGGIGPKSTRVDSTQNARMKNTTTLLIETGNISKDVPMSDAFEVHEKWVVQQDGSNVVVDVTCGVVWKKSAWGLKGTINSKSIEGCQDNFEHAKKVIGQVISKFTSARSAYQNSMAQGSSASLPSADGRRKKKSSQAHEEDESESSEEVERKKRKRRPSRKLSKDGSDLRDSGQGNEVVAHQASPASSPSGSFLGLSPQWQTILVVLVMIIGLGALSSLFFNMASLSTRLQSMETSKFQSGFVHEDMNLRERVAFLEHLTTALLHNISNPGSYKSEQQRYWMAIRDLDSFLAQTRDNVHTLQSTIHDVYSKRDEPVLTTATVTDALRTLPIDRKILRYLVNPEGFAHHLSAVLASDSASFLKELNQQSTSTVSAPLEGGTWWPIYFGLAVCVLILIAVAIGFGSKQS